MPVRTYHLSVTNKLGLAVLGLVAVAIGGVVLVVGLGVLGVGMLVSRALVPARRHRALDPALEVHADPQPTLPDRQVDIGQ